MFPVGTPAVILVVRMFTFPLVSTISGTSPKSAENLTAYLILPEVVICVTVARFGLKIGRSFKAF